MSSENAIQLTSSVASEGTKDSVTCRLCRRQFAKYTCPTCNVPYCSLTCFRSQAHNQCSESFYKKEVEADIHAGPSKSKSVEERQQMMEMLRKFEEQASGEQPFGEGEDGDGDGDGDDILDMAKRFEAVDLDTLSPDALWSMLTKEERSKFMKAFDDPTSDLAQQLLSNEQLEKEIQEPWWEAPSISGDESEHESLARPSGPRPQMIDIPMSMVKAIPSGHPLVYNMCAICIAYSYITRHLATSPLGRLKPEDPEYQEARRLFSQLVPFLTDRKSTQLYPNLPSVITGIWSLLDVGKMTSDLFAVLLRDASRLMRPLRITQVFLGTEESNRLVLESHPHCIPILVLSDLHALFSSTNRINDYQENQTAPKGNHIMHKLRFYGIHILSTPSVILDTLGEEMVARARGYEERDESVDSAKLYP